MPYSTRKPYQRKGLSPKEFFRAPARFLKSSVELESVFEKPYVDKEYGDMHQSPNLPDVAPPVAGSGGFKCLFSETVCSLDAQCFAGPEIKVVGGPFEAQAGYLEPVVLEGAIITNEIQDRFIRITMNPNVPRNLIQVTFVDGWGEEHTRLIDVTCGPPEGVIWGSSTGSYTPNIASTGFVDGNGKIHIATGSTDKNLYYYTDLTGSWISGVARAAIATTVSQGDVLAAITVDASGYIHILSDDFDTSGSGTYTVYYTTNSSGSWVSTAIKSISGDVNGDIQGYGDIIVDGSGYAHVVFGYSQTNGSVTHYLAYATNATGSWVVETVESNASQRYTNSMVRKAGGDFVIGFCYVNLNTVKVAVGTAGSWSITDCGATDEGSAQFGLAVDGSDYIHIVYGARNQPQIYHLTDASGSWVETLALNSGDYANFNLGAMVIVSGDLHTIFDGFVSGNGSHLVHGTDATGSWVFQTVATSGAIGSWSGLGDGPSGRLSLLDLGANTLGVIFRAQYDTKPTRNLEEISITI